MTPQKPMYVILSKIVEPQEQIAKFMVKFRVSDIYIYIRKTEDLPLELIVEEPAKSPM